MPGPAIGALPRLATLIVIDLQQAIDDPVWAKEGPRNNPGAEQAVARLLTAWRHTKKPIVHVRHDSTEPNSPYRPGHKGNDFKPEARPLLGEAVIAKRNNSAFIGTGLEARLRKQGWTTLVICGVITNNSVEATARHAGNLGFKTYLVADACFTFARRDFSGRLRSARDVHDMSLANLDGEYAAVVASGAILAALS